MVNCQCYCPATPIAECVAVPDFELFDHLLGLREDRGRDRDAERRCRQRPLVRRHGLDLAKTILGHSKVETTQIYAEKDFASAMELVARIG